MLDSSDVDMTEASAVLLDIVSSRGLVRESMVLIMKLNLLLELVSRLVVSASEELEGISAVELDTTMSVLSSLAVVKVEVKMVLTALVSIVVVSVDIWLEVREVV